MKYQNNQSSFLTTRSHMFYSNNKKKKKKPDINQQFEPTEQSAKVERKSQLAIVEQLAKNPTAFKEKVAKKQKKSHAKPSTQEADKTTKGLVNTRKAIRTLTGGRGATALENPKPLKKSKKRP
jgi:regulator of ribosome biosynthesis